MQVTFLVLAHHKPDQLATLLDVLVSEGDRVVVHVDASKDESPFQRAAAPFGAAVTFCARRREVRWGGFGAVAATLAALRQAVDVSPGDHYVLLSGVDYPVKPITALHRELGDGAVRMNCWPMPDERRGKPMSRLEHWYHAPRDRNSRTADRLNRLLSRLPKRDVRRALGTVTPHAGSQWWAMPHACAMEILTFVDRNPKIVRFFHHVRVPDEMFFQTVLMGLPKQWDVRPNLTYTKWPAHDRLSPGNLTTADFDQLATTKAFFARKFDAAADPDVLPLVKRRLLSPVN